MEFVGCNLCDLKFAQESGAMTFSGYGAVFGNVDHGGDLIEPGAFMKSLDGHRAGGTMPGMFYQHGRRGGGPDMPVGVWSSMSEDSHGLRVEGKLSDTTLGRDLYVLMKDKAVGGLSIGFKPIDVAHRSRPTDPRRTIKGVGLVEVSLVNDPMNPQARVQSVKSADELKLEIKKLSDLKDFLREVGGLSKSEAEAVCSNFRAKADRGEPDEADLAAILRRNINILTPKG